MHQESQTATRASPVQEGASAHLPDLTDEDLVFRAQRDPAQIDACVALLYGRYGDKVTTWCRRLCRDPTLAEDAAQEVFIKVQQRLDSFQGGSRFTTWLFVIARNSTLDFLAARRNQPSGQAIEELPTEPAAPEPLLSSALADDDLQARLRLAIQTVLEPDEARVVVLHCIHGMTLPAVTELMGLDNRSGAKALFVAAKRRLKSHFAKELSELSHSKGRDGDG